MLRSTYTSILKHRPFTTLSYTHELLALDLPASPTTPLNEMQFNTLLSFTEKYIPNKKFEVGADQYRDIAIDVNTSPFWINNKEEYMQFTRLYYKKKEAVDIWEETGFNYMLIHSQFGLIKYRIPFQIIYNPFTCKIELTPHTKQYEREHNKRNRKNINSLLTTYKTKLTNTIVGGEFRYKRRIKLVGMGMKVAAIIPHPNFPNQKIMEFQLGKSHIIPYALPLNVQVKLTNKRGTGFRLLSSDYESLQLTTASIRKIKPPEVYTGKGIVFHGETVVKKEGKKK